MQDIEIIRFEVPANKDHVVHLPKIKWDNSQEELWSEINRIFSTFGLIYRVFISQLNFYDEPSKSFFSFVRYFSKRAADKALHHSGRISINNQKLKICRSRKEFSFKNTKLSAYESEQLISHYFGFNFWNCKVTQLKKEKVERETCTVIKYVCQVRITTKDGLWSDGLGFGEAEVLNFRELGSPYRTAIKYAVHDAKVDAYSKFLIVSLSNGKNMIEVDTTKPDILFMSEFLDNTSVKSIGELVTDPDEVDEGEWIENLSEFQLEDLLGKESQ